MPGSREREVLSLIKYFKIASEYLDEISSNLIIFIPIPPHLKNRLINLTKDWNRKPIFKIINNDTEELFSQTSKAVVCSGTASLEIAKRKIPQIVIYKLNYFTEIILKFIISVKFANIINIMADKMIIPEIINSKLNKSSFLKGFKQLVHNDEFMNEKQIFDSSKYIDELILSKSPAEIAVKEIKNLLF